MTGSVPLPNNRRPAGCPFRPDAELERVREDPEIPRVPVSNPQLGAFDAVLVTRAADARQVLSDPRYEAGFAFDRTGPRTVMNQPGILLNYDGEEHARYRRMLTGAFTVKRVRSLTPAITRIIEAQLDHLEQAGRGADLIEAFAGPVPLLVICELLGIPLEDRDDIQRRSATGTDVANTLDDQLENFAAMAAYMGDLIRRQRERPGDDILGDLIRKHGGVLSDDELIGMGNSILVAGHETVSSMIGMSTLALLRDPEQLAVVRDDEKAAPDAVEELLRLLSVAPPLVRQADTDLDLGGQPVKAGERVVLSTLAANHGKDLVPDGPDRLDVRRDPVAHLAFGYGAHQCIGQQLARLELQIALPALLRRLPGLRLDVDFEAVEYREDALVFGVNRLPVTW
ncbi:cytochrome P450 [Streptomyces endophyticus]|uniref:Cytochrome P450 n=1 Tax=Streptomyces endophyticus TaxID=714166 RepID=A0ABU6F3W6_9ACTN|nr:cytochrome P450 [Streptomyces endophyticus]MEB8337542.1 cytochrome P450 [Streptomyces endophyticus]